MNPSFPRIVTFGTAEPESTPLLLAAGPLSIEVDSGAARKLCWYGVELIRLIDFPVRDDNWATCPFVTRITGIKTSRDNFLFECERSIEDGRIVASLVLAGASSGVLRASLRIAARRDFLTNRAGFTVAHPLRGLAGAPLEVSHSSGPATMTRFPSCISPSQVASDIRGMSYVCDGIRTSIEFGGETFELEDQRNWGDASYKTYCRPLSAPAPYLLKAGTCVEQTIEVRLTGDRAPPTSYPAATAELCLRSGAERLPTVALAIESPVALQDAELRVLQTSDYRALQVRVDHRNLERTLLELEVLARHSQIELETVIPADRSAEAWLAEVAEGCRQHGLTISKVIAVPELYLRSYQPDGPWPDGPTPRDSAIAARSAFPYARIGSGVLTNFAELNRCRPDTTSCDYIAHSFTPLVHAADDRSVVESLEGLSHVFASARGLADSREYSLGLVSIGMRSNPYGTAPGRNAGQVRTPMAQIDPRHRGLFAAAWAVGVVAATAGHAIASLALAAPVGPFGMMYRRADWPQPIYDDLDAGCVFPIFHVFRALSQVAQSPRLSVEINDDNLKIVAAQREEAPFLLVSNVSAQSRALKLPDRAVMLTLDQNTFMTAIEDPDWLATGPRKVGAEIDIAPYSVVFVWLGRSRT